MRVAEHRTTVRRAANMHKTDARRTIDALDAARMKTQQSTASPGCTDGSEHDRTTRRTTRHTRQGKQRKKQDGRSAAGDSLVARRYRPQTVYAMNLHGGTAHTHHTAHTHVHALPFIYTHTTPRTHIRVHTNKREAGGEMQTAA